jgi:hypothetical protein
MLPLFLRSQTLVTTVCVWWWFLSYLFESSRSKWAVEEKCNSFTYRKFTQMTCTLTQMLLSTSYFTYEVLWSNNLSYYISALSCYSSNFLPLHLRGGFWQFLNLILSLTHAGLDFVLACSDMSTESSSLMELVDDWLCAGELCPSGVGGLPLPLTKGHLL